MICLLLYFILGLPHIAHFHVLVLAMYLALLFAIVLPFVGNPKCLVNFLAISDSPSLMAIFPLSLDDSESSGVCAILFYYYPAMYYS